MMRATPVHPSRRPREEGIALMVVMVVFVVLYLVVFQLHFSTKMEEHMAQIRYGESENAVAAQSAVLFVIAHLVEDLRSDLSTEVAQGAAATQDPRGSTVPKVSDPKAKADEKAGGGTFSEIQTGIGGGSSKAHDALQDRIFSPNVQTVGQVSVKITMVDGERAFDLNRLFDYVRLPDEEVTPAAGAGAAPGVTLSDEELVNAVGGKTTEEAGKSLREKLIEKAEKKRLGGKVKGASAEGKEGAAAEGGSLDPASGSTAEAAISDYDPIVFEPPAPERVEMTRQMLERAIVMMFSVNENEYGYRYSQKFQAGPIANAIVEYVLARRQSPIQNRIYLVSELLNLPDVTPEVYYGPAPRVLGDEPFPVGNGFELRVDEFGDLVPEYVDYQADDVYEEEQKRLLGDLQQQFGQYADLAGLGLDSRLANPITRGMKELPVALDQNGLEYVPETPKALGLKDLFTTYSSGRININTAPVPIIFALLLSVSEVEANKVALDLKDYRQRFQEEIDETGGVADVTSGKEEPELGQPKRKKKDPEEEKAKAGLDSSALGAAAGALGSAGIDPSALGYEGSSYQDPELNYFTDLAQIELIDGSDGSPFDQLSSKEQGVQKVSKDQEDSLLRRVINDLQKVAVFSSTYFNAELKSKPKDGRGVKTGYLTIRRDAKAGTIDVLMWKNQER